MSRETVYEMRERHRKNREERERLSKKCREDVEYWKIESAKARVQLQNDKDQREKEKYGNKFKVTELIR